MSQAALLKAVRDTLQSAFSIDAESCEIGFDGQPKPTCGQEYWAVHPALWQAVSGDYDLEEEFTVSVTYSRRLGVSPKDRYGVAVYGDTAGDPPGVEVRARQVIAAVHHNQTLRALANTYIPVGGGNSGPDGFYTPLVFLGGGKPELKEADWFGAVPAPGKFAPAGVALTLTFGRARRLQTIGGMT